MSKKHSLLDYIILYGAFLIYSFVSVFAKIASQQDTFFKTVLFMAIEFVFLGIYAIIWQQTLKKFTLVIAMSSKGVTVILSLIWSVIFFSESITVMNIIGAVLIIVGIWVVSRDD